MTPRLAVMLAATSFASLGVLRPMVEAPRRKEPEAPPITEEEYSRIMRKHLPPSRQVQRAAERAARKGEKRMKRRLRI